MGLRQGLIGLALICISFSSQAEYRVFLLKIDKIPPQGSSLETTTTQPPTTVATSSRFVESTLDPEQYRGYYFVAPDEIVTYVDTWRCRGSTNGRPHCPSPRTPTSTPALPEGPVSP